MNRTRLLMIGVLALALGFFASVYVYKSLQSKSSSGIETGVDVIVAANDLQVGARVDEHDIKIIKVQGADLPPGAPRRRADVHRSRGDCSYRQGRIHSSQSAGRRECRVGPCRHSFHPGCAPFLCGSMKSYRSPDSLHPGTRVDVLLTGTPGSGGEQQTTTVLQNVAVLASGHTLERTSTGEAQTTAVITLLVSPDDAQRLTLASSEGQIQLALRNPLDTKQDEVPSSNSRGLYRGISAPATHPAHRTSCRDEESRSSNHHSDPDGRER